MANNPQFYLGNKRLTPGAHLPLLIVTAEAETRSAIAEHYIFTGYKDLPFICRMTGYELGTTIDSTEFQQIFNEQSVLAKEFNFARDNFENSIFTVNKDLHWKLFWEGYPFEWAETDANALYDLALQKMYKEQIAQMLKQTHCSRLKDHARPCQIMSTIKCEFLS